MSVTDLDIDKDIAGTSSVEDHTPTIHDEKYLAGDHPNRTLSRASSRPSTRHGHDTPACDASLPDLSAAYSTSSQIEPNPAPDGGLRAWTQVASAWLVLFLTWGFINSFGSFQAYYESVLPQSDSTVSWIGSVSSCLTFFVGAFSGRMLDAGFFRSTFIVGAVVQLLGTFLTSVSTKYWQLMLTQGIMCGLGGGILFVPCIALMSTYFHKKRALAVGISSTANAIGGMVYPIMVKQLLPAVGFSWTVRVVGFMNLTFLAVAFAFFRTRLPPRRAGPIIDWTAFKEVTWLCYVFGATCYIWAIYYSLYYVSSFGVNEVGMSFGESNYLVTIVNGIGLPFRVLVPMMADKTGTLNCSVPLILMTSLITFAWLGVHSVSGLYAWASIYGVISGTFQSMVPTGMANLTKRLDMIGTRMGMMFTIMSVGSLTGPPLGGALQGVGIGHYRPAQIWAGSVLFGGFVLLLAARISRVGWGLKIRC